MRYLVTTYADRIPTDHQIMMVDGTVPGWVARPGDQHWDHHRPDGAEIQMDEMPFPKQTLVEELGNGQPICFVTTLVDADACCAAAWTQLPAVALTPEKVARLRAIAWDCDHLMVPDALQPWAAFAAKAVATLKMRGSAIAAQLLYPQDRKQWSPQQWETYTSVIFKQGTEWLVAAVQGECLFPGEQGEADEYWQILAADTQQILQENRMQWVETTTHPLAVFDLRKFGHPVDPRSTLAALEGYDLETIRPETLTIREHRRGGGRQYVLGCIPRHPQAHTLNYTAGVFERLTQAERAINTDADSWGGRRTVGGSGWHTPSQLSPQRIAALLDT
ncbi:MAG: hypothetical protein HC851_14415 [Acaryochloris sp. RU_4_1]|nr:hypothetical protein [Acaryochloris sp. RU_4_1]NJR55626.1 hypothetical protein [Acaryochloris sp. CRU_2_0]